MTTTVDKARQYVTGKLDQDSSARKQSPSITISRMAGAGGTSVAAELAERLQKLDPQAVAWTVFDKNLIEKVLEDHDLPRQLAEDFREEKVSGFDAYIAEMLGGHPPLLKLVHQTSDTIHKLARLGNAIIIGRGANIVTGKLPNVLHVRLVGALDTRTERIARRDNISQARAKEFCDKMEKSRQDYIKQHFGKVIDDATLYHLVINTDRLSDSEVVDMIGEMVRRKFWSN